MTDKTSYLPCLRHVLPMTMVQRERRLPLPGVVTARVNERVQAQDVVAEAELGPQHMFIDLSRALGVPASEVPRYLRHQPGDRLDAGQILAGPVGVLRRAERAPAEGFLVTIVDGRVLFQTRGKVHELRAGFPGTVIASDGVQSVVIETTGALIQGVWGNGKQDFGILRMVGQGPGSRLQTRQLDIQLRGAVLLAGICENPAPLHQATELSVRGLILGSMSASLIPVARRLPYPVIVIEGFGAVPMHGPAFELLSSNAGREVALEGQPQSPYRTVRPEVIIPLPASREVDVPDELVPLEAGVRVRVTRAPYMGTVGVVREILPRAEAYPSGILAHSVVVDVPGGGPKMVPVANLEILS